MQVRRLAEEAGRLQAETLFQSTTEFKAFASVKLSSDATAGSFLLGNADVAPDQKIWGCRGKVWSHWPDHLPSHGHQPAHQLNHDHAQVGSMRINRHDEFLDDSQTHRSCRMSS